MAFKNPYAARLEEFSSFLFDQQNIFKLHGGWEEFFRSRMGFRPVRQVLEVGCSNAYFLSDIAKANPQIAFTGIDWKFKIIYKGGRRIETDALKNIVLLRGRAQELPKIFAQTEVSEIWVFFPDPWAKKSQLKNRLLQEPFLVDAHRVLKPGGKIYIKTDHPGYFQWVLSLFGVPIPELPEYSFQEGDERSYRLKQYKMRKLEGENLPAASENARKAFKLDFMSVNYWRLPERPQALFSEEKTLFEKSFVKDGLPIYYIELSKT